MSSDSKNRGMTGPGRHRCISAHQGSGVALARPATPGRAGSGPREVATSYHATHRWAPQCGSSSSGRHFSRFYIQPREAKGWVLSTYSSSVRVRERSAGAVAQRVVCCVEVIIQAKLANARKTCDGAQKKCLGQAEAVLRYAAGGSCSEAVRLKFSSLSKRI